ncbi:hypothetical protein ACFL5W_01125 [Thermodesulfobacteriota bacterium]
MAGVAGVISRLRRRHLLPAQCQLPCGRHFSHSAERMVQSVIGCCRSDILLAAPVSVALRTSLAAFAATFSDNQFTVNQFAIPEFAIPQFGLIHNS